MPDPETGSDSFDEKKKRIRMKKLAIKSIVDTFNGDENIYIHKHDIVLIFNYVENYCKMIHSKHIPYNIFTSSKPCSVFYIKNKVIDFFEKNGSVYDNMTINQIMMSILGEDKYSQVLETYFPLSPDSQPLYVASENIKPITGRMSDVSSGRKKSRKSKRSRRQNKKGKKSRRQNKKKNRSRK